jgi:hypothetical protein
MARLRPHLAIMDRHLAPRQGKARQALHLLALEDVVINGRLLAAGGDRLGLFRVPDHQVGIRPTRIAPFFG